MSPELDAEFKWAEETVLEVKRLLNKDKTADDERSTSVVGIIDQALEHHAAILLLLRSGVTGSAFALTRPVTEAVVRGVWLTACASDAEVMKFVKKDKIEPTYGEMSGAIDTTCGINYFAAFKTQSWKTLNSYTHTGMLQIGRRFTGDKLQPSYTDEEKIEVLRVITASILLLVRPFLARQGHLDSAKQIDKLMETRNYTLGHHLVAFLDVQGQREKFRELRLPQNAEEEAQVKEVLRQTAGFVVDLRNVFQQQFETFEKGAGMGAHSKEPVRPNFVGFSDSFVTSVPLRGDNAGLLRVITVFSALSAAAIVMLTSLASRHPLRGGIDVGLATEIGPGEIYGTALERAYVLESKVAQYPRIVIGDEFWKYLHATIAEFEKGSTPVAKSITAIIKRIMGLMAVDTDGNRILDYLGSTMVEHAGPDPAKHVQHIIQPVYEFVTAEHGRQIARGEAKLIARYEQLRSYVESRLPLWGLSKRGA